MIVWERYTEEARQAIWLAHQEAEALDDIYVSTEHLLVGTLHNRDGLPCRILDKLGIDIEAVVTSIRSRMVRGEGRGKAEMQLAFHGKRVLDKAIVESDALQDEHIGT